MATYRDGNVRRATPNTVTSMRRSAAARTCPKCHRKSAIQSTYDDWGDRLVRITWCRWKNIERAGYPQVTPRWYCDFEEVVTVSVFKEADT